MPRSGLSQVRPAVKGASDDQLARQERLPFRAYAALAQVVEHIIRNDGVRGSSPLSGTTHFTSFWFLWPEVCGAYFIPIFSSVTGPDVIELATRDHLSVRNDRSSGRLSLCPDYWSPDAHWI